MSAEEKTVNVQVSAEAAKVAPEIRDQIMEVEPGAAHAGFACAGLELTPSTFPLIQPGTNLIGIDQLSSLRSSVALLDFCPDLGAMPGQPDFLLVEQGNGVLHKLIHGLVWPALNVLLD
jgi:hypothetical protein